MNEFSDLQCFHTLQGDVAVVHTKTLLVRLGQRPPFVHKTPGHTRKPLNAEKTLPPNPVQTARMGQTTPGSRPPKVGLVCPQAPLKAP